MFFQSLAGLVALPGPCSDGSPCDLYGISEFDSHRNSASDSLFTELPSLFGFFEAWMVAKDVS